MESLYKQDKEQINYQSILLLNEIITSIQAKELSGLLYARHLPLVIPALGHPTKSALRKAAHTVLLNAVKNYPHFTILGEIYLTSGFLSEQELVQQKSINSFQSILILQAKHFEWTDQRSKKLVETLVNKIENENLFISKAASQCVLSICKMEGIKVLVKRMDVQIIGKLKKFLEDVLEKLPTDSFCITPNDLNNLIEESNKGVTVRRYELKETINSSRLDDDDDLDSKR